MAHNPLEHFSIPTLPELFSATTAENADLRALYESWTRWRGDRVMPVRSTDGIKDIKTLLKHIFLSDVVDNGADFRFKILGAEVFRGLGENQKGRLLSEFPDPGIRKRFKILMDQVVQTKQPLRGVALRETGHKSHDFKIESIWLPFGTDNVEQIMGMSVVTPLNL